MTNGKICKRNLGTSIMVGCLGAGIYKEMWKGNGFGRIEGEGHRKCAKEEEY
jgi:hypothetical protein